MKQDSCWTCRIRHKKCDAGRPACGGCATLEIDCHYHETKPDWMDNGDGQQQMVQRIKAQVKHSAKRRRSIARMETIVKDLSEKPDQALLLQPSRGPFVASPLHQHGDAAVDTPSQADASTSSPPPSSSCQAQRSSSSSSSMTPRSEIDMGQIVGYMEYVLPCLFPFYKPALLDGGRTWVLVLATKSNAFFSSIASLASYLFSIAPVRPGPGHDICAASAQKGLPAQVTSALSTVQSDLIALARRGVGSSVADSTSLLANIVQYLSFEVAIRSGNWTMHLEAATELLEQILEVHGDPSGSKKIQSVLKKLDDSETLSVLGIPNADQAAFKFFSTTLLVDDIIASTSLGRPPKLVKYHSELVRENSPSGVRTEYILGCQPWVLLILADIATLAAAKSDAATSDQSAMADITSRAADLENRIQNGMATLDEQAASRKEPGPRDFESFIEHANCTSDVRHEMNKVIADVTRIWAYAAHTYLLVAVHGWMLEDPRIRKNTASCIALFENMASPCWLRCMVWPFCITGCVALREQRESLYAIRNSMQALQAFGTVTEVMRIMEMVWSDGGDSWDIGACLKGLGYSVLLV